MVFQCESMRFFLFFSLIVNLMLPQTLALKGADRYRFLSQKEGSSSRQAETPLEMLRRQYLQYKLDDLSRRISFWSDSQWSGGGEDDEIEDGSKLNEVYTAEDALGEISVRRRVPPGPAEGKQWRRLSTENSAKLDDAKQEKQYSPNDLDDALDKDKDASFNDPEEAPERSKGAPPSEQQHSTTSIDDGDLDPDMARGFSPHNPEGGDGSKPLPQLRYDVSLDTQGNMQLLWDLDPATEILTFRLEAKVHKTDLLLFGFSAYGESTNADLVVMWTDYHGKHRFQDAHTDEEGLLYVDEHQDYDLDSVDVINGRLALTFHRLYDTCDDDDYVIDAGTTHIIFATRVGQLPQVKGLDIPKLAPGLQRAQLVKSQLPDPPLPDDAQTLVMHVENVTIPAVETTYWCSVKKLPEINEKHHIIEFEGAISPASQGIVHHLEVFHCEIGADETVREYNAPCKTMGAERPQGLEACRKVLGAWAMGAKGLSYPPEAGSPLGGPGFSRYIMMEVHYNNPGLQKGVVDSSGIKFTYTRSLRKHDAGIMELGQEYSDKISLPPGQPLWSMVGYCIPQCTRVALPEGGIKMFASQLHTHLTGKRVSTKHYRNGIELPELNRDNHYSPHYQQIRKLPSQVHVMPGDSLVTVCEDSTVDKTNITMGGFSISDEMCVNYVHYYPLVDLEVCKSSVTTESLYAFFRFLNDYNDQPTSPKMGISDNYKAIHWSKLNVDLLRTYYDSAPLSMQCNQSDGNRFPGDWENMPLPEVLFPMPPTERPCLQ